MDLFEALLAAKMAGGSTPEPTLVEKSITANGSYQASADDADGYSAVTVNVPEGAKLGTMTVSSGTFTPDKPVIAGMTNNYIFIFFEIDYLSGATITVSGLNIQKGTTFNKIIESVRYTPSAASPYNMINTSGVLSATINDDGSFSFYGYYGRDVYYAAIFEITPPS